MGDNSLENNKKEANGKVLLIHGDGKGKTSVANGTILRALGHDKKVRVVHFMKNWRTSEVSLFDKLQSSGFDLKYHMAGNANFVHSQAVTDEDINSVRKDFGVEVKTISKKDLNSAELGLKVAEEFLKESPFLLILDEINYALKYDLLSKEEVISLVQRIKKSSTNLILTGRDPINELKELADLESEVKKRKHYFDDGTEAIQGIDY